MAENIRTPQIRFQGFTDVWEERKLGDEVSICSGRDYKHLEKGDIPVYGTGGYMLSVSKALSYSDAIGIGRKGTIDHPYILKAPFWTVDTLFYAVPRQIEALHFIYCLFQKIDWKSKDESTGVPSLSKAAIEFAAISLPNAEEQNQIGGYFSKIDDIISLHQRKYEKLIKIKKALLEKMFPQDGASTPKIRFKGFTAAWELRKLGECFSERVESMPDGELISVTINEGIKKFSELGRHNNSNDDKSKYKKVCVGDIVYNSMRMWQGASGYSPYEGIVSPAYTVLVSKSRINSKCMAYQFKLPNVIHSFQMNSQGITSDNWNLKFPVLKEIEVYVSADEKEQELIAEQFTRIDDLIALHKTKLEKLKNIKSALLDKMFV